MVVVELEPENLSAKMHFHYENTVAAWEIFETSCLQHHGLNLHDSELET